MPKFKVIGPHAVFGCEPGESVEIEDEADIERLKSGGHIASSGRAKAVEATTEKDDA